MYAPSCSIAHHCTHSAPSKVETVYVVKGTVETEKENFDGGTFRF